LAVYIKSKREIEGIRAASRILAETLATVEAEIRPGVSLNELDQVCESFILSHGSTPTFKGYHGFPAAACISVNEEVVHGIPSERKLVEGDIVKVDIGVTKNGFIADAARTFEVGKVKPEVHSLIRTTEASFRAGATNARAGNRVSDIGAAVQHYVEKKGYSVVRELCGHGVGLKLHEEPSIPNFGRPGRGVRLKTGMTLAIEPMVNIGGFEVATLANGWTVVTSDGKPSAHYENTILVTDGEPEILTLQNG